MATWADNKRIRDEEDQAGYDALAPKPPVRGLEGRGFTAAEERAVHRAAGTDMPPDRKKREDY
jgi:hypothetical protein